jgi:hypothetical protein
MNKMKRTAGLYLPILLFLLAIGVIALRFWAQEACVEHPLSFTETFNTTDFEDKDNSSVAHWTDGPAWTRTVRDVLIWTTTLVTAFSGLVYVKRAYDLLRLPPD